MPRSVLLPALLALTAPAAGTAQHTAGAQLWRLTATTLAVPPALARGVAATFWNPAQPAGAGRFAAGLEVVQTPSVIGASGFLAAARLATGPGGHVGVTYGRMALRDLVRTTVSPDPVAGAVPYDVQTAGLTWSHGVAGGTVGVALRYHYARLDDARGQRVTLDVGATRAVGSALRVAAATHFLSSFSGDPRQDVYGGVEYRWFRGPLWRGGREADLVARYGVALAHGFGIDHFAGVGLALGDAAAVDLLVAREGGYAAGGWRPVGGLAVSVGRYRVTVARDAGVRDIGSAFRVGLEVRLP